MNIIKLFPIIVATTILMSSCNKEDIYEDAIPPVESQHPDDEDDKENDNNDANKQMSMIIKVGSKTYTVTLEGNATSTALKELLPLTLNMSELNGNEKYDYLQSNLPTAASNVGTIQKGDVMLYGSNCLVIFYKTFNTSYRYTRIGHIDNADDIDTTLGDGSVSITFE